MGVTFPSFFKSCNSVSGFEGCLRYAPKARGGEAQAVDFYF